MEKSSRNHRLGHAAGAEVFEVAQKAELLQAVVVEVYERNGCKGPGARNSARCSLEARDQAEDVADQNEEEHRGQEGHMLLEAAADNVFGNALVHELIAVFHRIEELVGRNELELLRGDKHDREGNGERDEQPDDVLGDFPTADAEHRVGIEVRRETLRFRDELIESFAHEIPSLLAIITCACVLQAHFYKGQTRSWIPKM